MIDEWEEKLDVVSRGVLEEYCCILYWEEGSIGVRRYARRHSCYNNRFNLYTLQTSLESLL